MEHNRQLRDSDIEALIAGRQTTGAELDELARFVTTAKAVLPEALDPAVEQRHLAVLMEAAHLIQPGGSGQKASTRRSRTMLSTLFASLWVKIAAVAMTALAATGGLAAANALGPAQDTVASVGDALGLDLPSSDDDDDATEVDDADEADDDDDADEAEDADDEADDEADDADEADDDDDADEAEDADDEADDDEADDDEADDDEADDDSDEADDDEADSDEVEDADDEADDDDDDDADEVEDDDDDSDEESSEES